MGMMNFPPRKGSVWLVITILVLLIAIASGVWFLKNRIAPLAPPGYVPSDNKELRVESFGSADEFRDYLAKSSGTSLAGGGFPAMTSDLRAPMATSLEQAPGNMGGVTPERVSGTNVQVKGIDEPDIVKTDGREIYYSSPGYGIMPVGVVQEDRPVNSLEIRPVPSPIYHPGVRAIKAFPPAALKVDADLGKNGEMLISGNTLVVFSPDKITGFDVSSPTSPMSKWEFSYKNNSSLVNARLYQDKIYIVTRTGVDYGDPCPIIPFTSNARDISIPCLKVYHPIAPVPVDTTYSVLALDPTSGEVTDSTSFVASAESSALYMSGEAIYLAYYYPGDFVTYFYNFLKENPDLVGQETVDHLGRVRDYDLSDSAKIAELMVIMQRFENGSGSDARLKLQNEMTNRMEKYSRNHKRELERTGLVKITSPGLDVAANGSVPGRILNQFSLDEHAGNLRLATTIGQNFWGLSAQTESTNDVYVLNANLDPLGAVLDLGQGERIYSARFVGDRGYLVTFKQIDPFFILDLSNPGNPRKTGELKIPGFSSYLHPLAKHLVLGVGQENGKVKLSLFDVSQADNPIELDKYLLDEYWTEVSSNHHAFLQDPKHQIFFLPGSIGGYVFSYAGDRLKLEKAVAGVTSRRAVYINDYLYLLGDNNLVVLNETNWERVSELSF